MKCIVLYIIRISPLNLRTYFRSMITNMRGFFSQSRLELSSLASTTTKSSVTVFPISCSQTTVPTLCATRISPKQFQSQTRSVNRRQLQQQIDRKGLEETHRVPPVIPGAQVLQFFFQKNAWIRTAAIHMVPLPKKNKSPPNF